MCNWDQKSLAVVISTAAQRAGAMHSSPAALLLLLFCSVVLQVSECASMCVSVTHAVCVRAVCACTMTVCVCAWVRVCVCVKECARSILFRVLINAPGLILECA